MPVVIFQPGRQLPDPSGIGSLLVGAVNSHDFPVAQAVLLLMVTAYIVVTTAVDLVHPLLDPCLKAMRSSA